MRNDVVQTRCNHDSGVGPLSLYKEGISFAWVMGAPTATRDKQKPDSPHASQHELSSERHRQKKAEPWQAFWPFPSEVCLQAAAFGAPLKVLRELLRCCARQTGTGE